MLKQKFKGIESRQNNKQIKPSRAWARKTFKWNRYFETARPPEHIKAFWIFSRSKKILSGDGVV